MNKLTTASVGLAVTPTVLSTLFSHYLNKSSLKERPTAHLSYDEGLHLVRSFLEFASHHTVEELQAFTAQWVPHPQWVKVDVVDVPAAHLDRSAELIQQELGNDGIRQVGGRNWWQWRKLDTTLKAEWIEMKADATERKRNGDPGQRVMLYVHGGAYYFGSVDEHRYQMQRHARKLKAKVLAPRYRLSPQFPFPCGLQDCLAAYLYLLTVHDPSHIILAGDSAGGGMVISILCLLRDQGIPLPAGAILISPWVDLTHSFPSVAQHAPLDYIPESGFHHKPSRSWPPPNEDDIKMLQEEANKRKHTGSKDVPDTDTLKNKQQAPVISKEDDSEKVPEIVSGGLVSDPDRFLTVTIDGKLVTVKDQIQFYTTNSLLNHPLVSPVMQPTLGGLPPLLIVVGGGEFLRDEQIYLAHKCANPTKFAPPSELLTERGKTLLEKYKATDVQLQVWDDLCHVAPTLSFTRPAKFMYRSIAQFGAWALARAQQTGIEILNDDDISVISSSGSGTEVEEDKTNQNEKWSKEPNGAPGQVGKAGDPLPRFKNHMIRQRVTRHGVILPLAPEEELPGCCMKASEIGKIKEGPVKKWLHAKSQWDTKYAASKAKVHKKIIKDLTVGYQEFGPGEHPPLSALAGRRRNEPDLKERKRTKSLGLALWSLWGSKHDELTVEREQKAEQQPDMRQTNPNEGQGARGFADIQAQVPPPKLSPENRSTSRRRIVTDENQTEEIVADENTPVAQLLELRREKELAQSNHLSPDYEPETGAAGKRPYLDGIALPFSLKKEAETVSMLTLNSVTPLPHSRPTSPGTPRDELSSPFKLGHEEEKNVEASTHTPQRPEIETFVTAQEDLPRVTT
ncbi:AB hydrolase superfamily protein [Paramyrothecium foliicola]|nr:AB hydrolase superfamily protein [Paramyrothecium foliicola]